MIRTHPRLEVITGPMFSGKSTELLRRLRRAQIAGLSTVLVRPSIDHTKLTHDGQQMDYVIASQSDVWPVGGGYDVIGIDEVQFLPNTLDSIIELSKESVVIVAGLDTTFAYEPFTILPQLLSYAERVDKLTAVCVKCGDDATRTQRIVNGQPASRTDPVVLVGDEDFYEARCSRCWEITS